MKNEGDYIEKLFSEKLETFEAHTSEEEWNTLSSKLRRSNFLKFSFASFNILYLSAFLTLAGTIAFMGVQNRMLSIKIAQMENGNEVFGERGRNQPSPNTGLLPIEKQGPVILEGSKNHSAASTNIKIVPTKSPDLKTLTSQHTEKNIEVDIKSKEKPITPIDTTNITKPDKISNTAILTADTPPIRIVRKTVVIKQNDVIVKDTVVIKKRIKK